VNPVGNVRRTGPARHELPVIDDAALLAARAAERVLGAIRERGSARWELFFSAVPDRLRDADLRDLRTTALRARAAFGPKDSVREVVSPDLSEPLLDAIDGLLKAIARHEVNTGP